MAVRQFKQDVVLDTIRASIINGEFRSGDRLPTNRELAAKFGFNARTIAAGLTALVEEGIIERAPGRGTIVRGLPGKPVNNAVALMAADLGDFYRDVALRVNMELSRHGLFPVVMGDTVIRSENDLMVFLKRLGAMNRPYGNLIIGERFFPYQKLMESPESFANSVFMFHYHWKELVPSCRYVLTDFDAAGQLVVKYFAERKCKRIMFAAIREKDYDGAWSSMQEQLMISIRDNAAKAGIFFDEALFWDLMRGKADENFDFSATGYDGIFSFSDCQLVMALKAKIMRSGRKPGRDVFMLGSYNTGFATEFGIDSLDFKIEETVKIAVGMLTGEIRDRHVTIRPGLALNESGI